jgi:uncharacterized tellurite resistance protein B-like protein
MAKRESPAETLKRFEGVSHVVADDLRFKRKLAIGEDAYTSIRLGRAAARIWDVGGVAASGAAAAASPVVAGTLFGSTGFMAAIGLGAVAVTPVGWVVAAAAVSGAAYFGVTRLVGGYAESRVEVIPRYINSPIDQLGAALLDMMGLLSLKVAAIDGKVEDAERNTIADYFVAEWGYDPIYAKGALDLLEANALAIPLKDLATALKAFASGHPDCNAKALLADLLAMLREVAEADGKLDEREELAIDAIGIALRA